MTPKTAPRKAPSARTLRRQFLAVQKPTVEERLSPEEYKKLHDLTEEAMKSNHRLIEAGERLNQVRCALSQVEADFIATRTENQNIHAEMAPLLHRLPTV